LLTIRLPRIDGQNRRIAKSAFASREEAALC